MPPKATKVATLLRLARKAPIRARDLDQRGSLELTLAGFANGDFSSRWTEDSIDTSMLRSLS
jgi:hypothetical protein